jgi:hypothetical protein
MCKYLPVSMCVYVCQMIEKLNSSKKIAKTLIQRMLRTNSREQTSNVLTNSRFPYYVCTCMPCAHAYYWYNHMRERMSVVMIVVVLVRGRELKP